MAEERYSHAGKLTEMQRKIQKEKEDLLKGTLIEETVNSAESEPTAKIDSEETVVGEMTNWEVRLYTASTRYRKISDMIQVKVRWDPITAEEKDKLMSDVSIANETGRTLMKLLWAEIRHRLDIGDVNLGVRSGRKIVTFERDSDATEITGNMKDKMLQALYEALRPKS
jgi:hypothetical protein